MTDSERLARFLKGLARDHEFGPQLVHLEEIRPQPPVFGELAPPLSEPLRRALDSLGVNSLYSHQVEAIESVRKGQKTIVATPTASGKSLIYWIPVIERLAENPESKAIFIFPLKALEQDQLRGLRELAEALERFGGPRVRIEVYDGDTPPAMRRKIKSKPPQIIITNPDMLHLGFLAYHDTWAEFFSQLELVVLDEAHTYRGIFGSHIVQIIRRLRRICELYGADPNFLLSTATIDNPESFGERLIGHRVNAVMKSGAPSSGRSFVFLNPELSAPNTAARLLLRAVRQGLKTITFTQARKVTELIHMWVSSWDKKAKISSYRAGFLPSERRKIESRLASGELDGVVSTSALELGIDIGELDLCLLVGYPGTVVTTWQRAGRVGRMDRPSAVVLIAQPDALDQYIVKNPDDFFGRGYEPAVVDPNNPEVLGPHLVCAAAELELAVDDSVFDLPDKTDLLKKITESGRLLMTRDERFYVSPHARPHLEVNIRTVGETYTIMKGSKKKAIGTLDEIKAFKECHPEAIYLHLGQQYEVDDLDLEGRNVWVHPVTADYYTRALADKETEILEVLASRPTPNFIVRLGRIKVTEQIIGFEKRRIRGQELLSKHELELPSRSFETVGLWIEIEPGIKDLVVTEKGHFMGAIHALEHAAIAIFPLLALCDRNDIGGIAYPLHPQIGKSAVFIYDGYPGGVGLAATGFKRIEELLEKARAMVETCGCEEGCPSCIHSPKCGAGNKPLDKPACLVTLEALLGRREWAPEPVQPGNIEIVEDEPGAEEPERLPVGVFDLETQRLAKDVGGWGNIHLMGLAVAVVYDGRDDDYKVFTEDQASDLIALLQDLPLVVGFNHIGFDYRVLSAYTDAPLSRIPSLDLLLEFKKAHGFRVSLDKLAHATLNSAKSASGLKAVEWFRNGELDKVIEYCTKDVEITKELFEFGVREGFVVAPVKGHPVELQVDWATAVNQILG